MSVGISASPSPPSPAVGLAAVPSAVAHPGSGSASYVDPVSGSMVHDPEEKEPGLFVQSGGVAVRIPFTPAQKTAHTNLHAALTTGHPNASVNLSRGFLVENGQIVKYLDQDPNSADGKALKEMRQFYHEVLGQDFSDTNWAVFREHDRAAEGDSEPFAKRKESEVLKKVKIEASHCPDKNRAREFHAFKKLHKGIVDILDRQAESVDTRIAIQNEARKKQIHRMKEQFENLDEVVMGFHAAFPPPDLDGKTLQQKIDALNEYKQRAAQFLNDAIDRIQNDKNAVKRLLSSERSEHGLNESIDQMAKEMALMACVTRQDYDLGCIAFEVRHTKTTPELFVARLSALIADPATSNGEIDQFIDEQIKIAFNSLSEDDRGEVYGKIAILVVDIQDELDDPRLHAAADAEEYSRRIEHLDIADKQQALANAQRKLGASLIAIRPAFGALQTRINALADRQATLTQDLKNLANASGDLLRTKKTELETIEREQAAILADLESAPNPGELRRLISTQKDLIERQKAYRAYIEDKDVSHINPWHKKPELASVTQGLAPPAA